ncbi:protein BCCIP homolog [Anguilla anguilla]|uniref:protein BCCIP homolog n=1 Tax=Anguilla anguilla TaxID=7936 RepID=UPI0015ABD6A9|nr:protein BCCIP homolog [Anguilla anguilla]
MTLDFFSRVSLVVGSMASSAKKRAVGVGENPDDREDESSSEGSQNDSDSGEEDSNDSDEEINEEVTVDFEAHTISDNDKNGIKKLLQQLFLKAHVNMSELTDIIIQQNHIGSVIRQAEVPEDSDEEDPDEVFGFISLLNLTERKGVQCVEQVKDLVLSQCAKCCPHSVAEQLEKTLNDTSKPVGLLLSERFINVPPQIALPLHKQLLEEMAEAQRTNKPSGKCHYCLMICKTCKEAKRTVPGRGAPPNEELMFANAEEEFFYEQAVVKFNYSVQEEADSCLSGRWSFDDVPMKPYRTVVLIPMDRMGAIMDKLKEYLTV